MYHGRLTFLQTHKPCSSYVGGAPNVYLYLTYLTASKVLTIVYRRIIACGNILIRTMPLNHTGTILGILQYTGRILGWLSQMLSTVKKFISEESWEPHM